MGQTKKMREIEVVAAIIIHSEKILCVQRNQNKYSYISMKYEFPGGKIEDGETHHLALSREIKEELNMEIDIKNEFLSVKHQYPDFHLTMHSYLCISANNIVTLMEHIDYKWLDKSEIGPLDWAAADIPIVEKLLKS